MSLLDGKDKARSMPPVQKSHVLTSLSALSLPRQHYVFSSPVIDIARAAATFCGGSIDRVAALRAVERRGAKLGFKPGGDVFRVVLGEAIFDFKNSVGNLKLVANFVVLNHQLDQALGVVFTGFAGGSGCFFCLSDRLL